MGRCLCVLAVLALWGLPVAPSFGQNPGGQETGGQETGSQDSGSQDPADQQPFVVSADELVVDNVLNIVIARGNVEVAQSGRLLTADTITYNPRNGVVTASGNVVLVEPTGDVLFAEYAELDSELTKGFIEGIGILFSDESRLAADRGIRRGEITEVGRAVYSPCALCEEDPDRAPLWQLRAGRVVHDAENNDIIYEDAFLDFYGVPVFYTPYFSHPDPSVDRRSGFLVPQIGSTSDLGPFLRSFYYWNIAPNQDATLQAGGTRDAGFILGGEYRHRFEYGQITLDGSVNRSDRTEVSSAGETVLENQLRGHIFADAQFHLNENWRIGADIQQSSDDTYLNQFEVTEADVLTSRIYAEGFYGLSYAVAEVNRFQDQRRDTINQPLVAPAANYTHVSEPGSVLGGRWIASADTLNLVRDEDVTVLQSGTEGVDSRRFSLETGWQREFSTDFGLLTNFETAVRGDLYWSDDLPTGTSPAVREDNVVEFRAFPRATITSSFPMVRQQGTIQQLMDPVLAFTAAPNQGNVDEIPNNDSVDIEFDEINLFSDSRFTGVDRVEGGLRFTYGLRLGVFGFGGGSTTFFAGQSYSLDDENDFPSGSGLENQQSDWVGRLTITPSPLFNLDYRFRFDHEKFDGRRQEVSLIAGPDLFRIGANYTFVDQVAGTSTDADVEEVTARFSSRFAGNWVASGSFRRDLVLNESRNVSLGLAYGDECITIGIDLRRDFTEDRDTSAGDSVFLTISLRHLGELPFSVKGGDLFD